MSTYTRQILILLLMAVSSAGCKKGKLEWNNVEKIESHTTDRLNEITFTTGETGFIVGGDRFQRATILKTIDGGATWIANNYPEAGKGIYGVNITPDNKVYAVGYDGKVLVTNNNGNSWQFSQLQYWKECKDIAFFDKNNGIIIAGVSFKNGYIFYIDENLKVKKWDSLRYELNDIATKNNIGYLCGYGVVQKTTNGGNTWNIQKPTNDNFTALHMLNEQELWVCGLAGSIYHTTDGGNNWDKLRNGNKITIPKYTLLDIYFLNKQIGWAVGEEGLVIRTNDGGKKWIKYKSFTKETLRSITLAPDGKLITVGDNGNIYKLAP